MAQRAGPWRLGLQNRGSSPAVPDPIIQPSPRQALGFSDDRVFRHYGVAASAAGRSERQLNEIGKSDRTQSSLDLPRRGQARESTDSRPIWVRTEYLRITGGNRVPPCASCCLRKSVVCRFSGSSVKAASDPRKASVRNVGSPASPVSSVAALPRPLPSSIRHGRRRDVGRRHPRSVVRPEIPTLI